MDGMLDLTKDDVIPIVLEHYRKKFPEATVTISWLLTHEGEEKDRVVMQLAVRDEGKGSV